MEEITIHNLGELCEVVDCPHSTPKWTNSGKYVIRNFNIKNGRLVLDKPSYTDEATYISRNRRAKPEPGDLILTREAPMGEICVVPENIECCLGQRVVLLKVNKNRLLSKYLLYLFLSEIIQSQIQVHNGAGSVVSNLRIPYISELKIPLPPLPVQHRIAEILGALDDKIELNRQMNHTLEQMAQALYKHYFVEDIDLENLPDGWRNGIVSDILTLEYGKSLREDERKGGIFPVIGSSGVVGFHNASLVKGKGIVVGRKGNAGSVIWCDDAFYPIDTTFYVVSKFSDTSLFYTFFLLKSLNLESYNSDSAVPGLNRNHAHDSEIIIPVESVISDFNNQTESLFQMIAVNKSEIVSLTKTRDYLLPKLISGEIIPSDLQTIEQAL